MEDFSTYVSTNEHVSKIEEKFKILHDLIII